jgi:hypothetical protein
MAKGISADLSRRCKTLRDSSSRLLAERVDLPGSMSVSSAAWVQSLFAGFLG